MKVKLTYFKRSGKYYSEGEYESTAIVTTYIGDIWEEVRDMNVRGSLPGLVDGSAGWIVLVDCVDHPDNHPYLVM